MTAREKAAFLVGCYETAAAILRGDMPDPDHLFEVFGAPDGVTELMLSEIGDEALEWLRKYRLLTDRQLEN
jgi:hypothetical protein